MSEVSVQYRLEINRVLQVELLESMSGFLRHEFNKDSEAGGKNWIERVVRKPFSDAKLKDLDKKWTRNGAQGVAVLDHIDVLDYLIILSYWANAKHEFKNERIGAYARLLIIERNASSHINKFELIKFKDLEEAQFIHAMMTIKCLEDAIAEACGGTTGGFERKYGEAALRISEAISGDAGNWLDDAESSRVLDDAWQEIVSSYEEIKSGLVALQQSADGIKKDVEGVRSGVESAAGHVIGHIGEMRLGLESAVGTMGEQVIGQIGDMRSGLESAVGSIGKQMIGQIDRKLGTLLGESSPKVTEGNHMHVNGVVEVMFDRFGIDDKIDGMLAAGRPIYTHAVGGVGKTRVAQAYCASKHAEKYNYVFWVSASTPDIRSDVMAEPAFMFSQIDDEQTDINVSFMKFVNQHRKLTGKVLLVIDGVELESQVDSIESHLPKLGWDLLITTRSVKKDASFEERVLPLEELEIEYCRELFYKHFGNNKRKQEDEQKLDKLIEALSHNSYMIRLFAKQGNYMDYTVSELYEMMKSADSSEDIYQYFINNARALFDASKLTDVDKSILAYFTTLPVKPIPEKFLLKWCATKGVNLKKEFRSLYEKGWLLHTISSDEVCFQCHSLINAALKDQIDISEEDLDRFIGNVADFFDYPPSERRNHMYLVKYFDFADAIIESCDNPRMAMLRLKLNYLSIVNHFECNPPRAMAIATDILENYKAIYDSGLSPESNELKYDVLFQYNVAFSLIMGASRSEKQEQHMQQLEKLLQLATEIFPENDLRVLRVRRRILVAHRNTDPEKTLEKQLELLSDMDAKLLSDTDDREFMYSRIVLLRGIGLTCNRIRPLTVEMRKRALGYYRMSYEAVCLQYGPESSHLTIDYNNIGISLSRLYKHEPLQEYLDEAKHFLIRSYEMRLEHWSSESLSVAFAINNLAYYYIIKKDFNNALEYAYEGLRIRKAILQGENPKIASSYHRLAEAYLAIFEDRGDVEALHAAKQNAEISVRIGSQDVSGAVSIQAMKDSLKEIEDALAGLV